MLAYDAVGFGARLTEVNGAAGGNGGVPLFYRRYPEWSLLGKIVHDCVAAIDLAVATGAFYPAHDPPINFPTLDHASVFLLGYDIGGRAALYAAALDPAAGKRLKGVVSINGWTPMRTDTNTSRSGGNRRLWDWHGLQASEPIWH